MSLSLQGNQYFPAGHVLQSAIGLEPVPFLAEYFGDLGAATAPMFIEHGLNEWQIDIANSSFSDGYGQHDEYISEEERGRQQKMQGDENIFSGEFLVGNPAGGVGR